MGFGSWEGGCCIMVNTENLAGRTRLLSFPITTPRVTSRVSYDRERERGLLWYCFTFYCRELGRDPGMLFSDCVPCVGRWYYGTVLPVRLRYTHMKWIGVSDVVVQLNETAR